jgi:hypothetical protein
VHRCLVWCLEAQAWCCGCCYVNILLLAATPPVFPVAVGCSSWLCRGCHGVVIGQADVVVVPHRPDWLRGGESPVFKPQPEIYRRLGLKVPWEGPQGSHHRTTESGQVGSGFSSRSMMLLFLRTELRFLKGPCCSTDSAIHLQRASLRVFLRPHHNWYACMAAAAAEPLPLCGRP